MTVWRVTPTRRAISAFGNPSAASNTIRVRPTRPAGADDDRVNARSRAPSPSRSANGAATRYCRVPTTV
jgi:hypothetical protein